MDTLPDRVDSPWPWTPSLQQAPIGPVPIVVGGSTLGFRNPLTGSEASVAFVDISGTQRVLDISFDGIDTPGEGLLLSPDGAKVAYPDQGEKGGLVIRELSGGTVRTVPPEHDAVFPWAWSPDQAHLLVSQYRLGGGIDRHP